MKRRLKIAAAISLLLLALSPVAFNWVMANRYDSVIATAKDYKGGPSYFPDRIPSQANRVRFRSQSFWTSEHSLSFQLPESEAFDLHAELQNLDPSEPNTPKNFPKRAKVKPHWETILWKEFEGNHGEQHGIWFDPENRRFSFYHHKW